MDTHGGSTGSWDYLDFELEIRVGGPREYPVAVRSPAGEAQGQMRFPFDEWELKDRLQSLEIALLRSEGTRRRIPSPEEHTVQDFGRGLFESLLVGDVRTRYEMSLSEARRQGKGLRLKLRIQPSELAVLPWEFLYDAERDRYPSLSSNTPLVRYLDLPQPVEPLRVSPPLRVLGMVTSPLGLDQLDVEHEKRLVEEATRGLREGGLLELTWLEGQTWRHLQRAMRRGPWHIFHFVGHGGFDPATEEGALALSNDAGHMDLLRATGLAELLDDHYPLRLVFLNSCEGARGSENDAFSSTAATLVRRGVPAVVAMQYEITDRAAIEFSRDFYEALADNLPVDAAVTEARAAVSMDSTLEWGTPVLYMHSPDGRVFDLLASSPRAHPPPETGDRQEEDQLRQYREGVESTWANGKLESNDVHWLGDLANNQLRLSPAAAANIEREVMGDTKEAILERLERASRDEEHRMRLRALYAQARRSNSNQQWQATLDLFEEIHAEDPAYPDPEKLKASALDALEAQERTLEATSPYDEGQRTTDTEAVPQALDWVGILGQTWWALALRGLVFVILGVIFSFPPLVMSSDSVLAGWVYGGLMLVDGALALTTGIKIGRSGPRWLLIEGMISILAGLLASTINPIVEPLMNWPWMTEVWAILILWVLAIGIIRVVTAMRLGRQVENNWLLIVSGALSVIFGLLAWVVIAADNATILPYAGIWALASGVVLTAFAFLARKRAGSELAE